MCARPRRTREALAARSVGSPRHPDDQVVPLARGDVARAVAVLVAVEQRDARHVLERHLLLEPRRPLLVHGAAHAVDLEAATQRRLAGRGKG